VQAGGAGEGRGDRIDGTKVHANASHHSNVDYEQLAREILKEAAKVDAEEDELYGDARRR